MSRAITRGGLQDRFTTDWKEGSDPRAKKYAKRNGIGFYDGAGNLDIIALREANRASDAEKRAIHAADQELDTGIGYFIPGMNWAECTRGFKLRTIARESKMYSE